MRAGWIGALFFASGMSALAYQAAWQRVLGLFAGSDNVAASLVVGAFLLGLGLGSSLGGIWADRLSRRGAVIGFAVCEAAIALYAGPSPWWMHAALMGPLADWAGAVFPVAFALLLVPTMAMGISVPLLARVVAPSEGGAAPAIGRLIAANTFGAAAGALGAGWWLIGSFGYGPTTMAAAALNVAVALAALPLARGLDLRPGTTEVQRGERAAVIAWCLRVAVSGFLVVGLQIVWYRLLGVLMQSSAYAFSLILAVFLLGDALGLLAGARLVGRITRPKRVFGLIVGGMVLVAGATVLALLTVFATTGIPGRFVEGEAPALALAIPVVLLLVLPGSFLAGLSYPVAQLAIQTDAAAIGRRVGLVQLANILANAAGSLVTGLVLIDHLGTSGTLVVLLAGGAVFALASWRGVSGWAMAAAIAAVATLLPANGPFWARLHGAAPDAIVVEDRSGVVVIRTEPGGIFAFFIGGHAQSAVPYFPVHAFLGSVGVLTHPAPTEVLVIGVAGGGTPHAALANPLTQRVDAIDIVGADLEALRQLAGRGSLPTARLLADPRLRLIRADGRHRLFAGGARYDVIEADAMLPTTAFSGALYSREFFTLARRALKPGGIVVQWAPTERVRDTFVSVFPHAIEIHPAGLMRPDRSVMLGADSPIALSAEGLAARYVATAGHFAAAVVDPARLHAGSSGARLVVWTPDTPRSAAGLNEDLFPRDEFARDR